ncbi:hypothetical protein M5689_004827 [Euphorbia peplus]|nr:hypothetical protein M5689_004827 [Euphorbia peplus]
MRIRKNKNLSSLMFSHASGAEPLQSHVCQLNQSPWDVIPFSPYPSSSRFHHQFGDEDSLNGNGSLGDSIGAVESNSFPDREREEEEKKVEVEVEDKMLIDIDNNSEIEEDEHKEDEMKIDSCEKTYIPKEWQCKNEKKRAHSISEESHLTSVKSCSDNVTKTKKNAAPLGRPRGRGRPPKKGTTSKASNPYEFYYYSGFGPLWGKQRGGGKGRGAGGGAEIISKIAEIDENDENTTSSSDHFDNLDYLDDDDSENDENVKKKRMRKPVKARSLKSLM